MFERKKIQSETLSEYLVAVRDNLNLSPGEVSKTTGLKPQFLQALETGDFKVLPADVYVYGFLRQLAQVYLIEPGELIDQYKKEKGIQQQVSKQSSSLGSDIKKNFFSNIVLTPKVLTVFLGLFFVAATISYIIWQVWSINKAPSLTIYQPANNAVIESAAVDIKGKTDPGMQVTVNGQSIFVDSQGKFATQLGLNPGAEEIVVTAENRFNKTVSNTINITGAAPVPGDGTVVLTVNFTAPVSLGYILDEQPAVTANFNTGDSKTFTAKEKILLSTSNAGATKITLNGQNLGAMGKSGEALTNVQFLPPLQNPSATSTGS